MLPLALALLSGCVSNKGETVSLSSIESFTDLIGNYQAQGTNYRNLTNNLFWQQNVRVSAKPDSIQFVGKENDVWVQALKSNNLIAEYSLSTTFEIKNGMILLSSSVKSRASKGGHERNDPGAMMPTPTPPMVSRSNHKTYLAQTAEGDICIIEKTSGAGFVLIVPMIASTKETSTFMKIEMVDPVRGVQ